MVTVKELKNQASTIGLKLKSGLKKQEIIELIL